ncbi:glutamate receptor ionotropic, kainate 2-like [Epargyreus clarus]|uniref:glutamate receptor ionotropic, kainate 2-like n=1 Tax=Epargyreus clarus TaxID=520877 RepID=UPI003C2D7594
MGLLTPKITCVSDGGARRRRRRRQCGLRARPACVVLADLGDMLHLLLPLLLSVAAQSDVQIGVVEGEPTRAERLAAALDAALGGPPVDTTHVEPLEPLALPPHVCLQASRGVSAVVSGGEAAAAAARAGLPLLLATPARGDPATLQLHPHPDVLAEACAALCEAKGWRSAVLLHEGSARGVASLAPDPERLQLVARQLPPAEDEALLRNLLLVLKKYGATNFIIWCEVECAWRVLDAAQRVGLLAARHSYLVLAPDLHTAPLADFSYGGANITVVQLFDPESEDVIHAMEAWRDAYRSRLGEHVNETELEEVTRNPPSALVLAFDAARIVQRALERLQLPPGEPGSCESGTAAFHADTLLNYIRSEEWAGASGPLAWGADGARREVRLRVAELAARGTLVGAAAWAGGALAWRPRAPGPPPPRDHMVNRTFTVLVAENKPYVMKQQSSERLLGNKRYEGFCIELIERLAQLLQFNYVFAEQEDGVYGSLDKNGQWTGMMRRLINEPNIDFAITDLTITAEREKAVDFTTPFMNLGISILFRKPAPPEPALFAFLLPFSNGVWLCLGFAYLGTSLVLYVVGRLCPEEWQNPYPCVEEPPALENQFTLANALWFNLGAVLLQGSEIAPVAYGTRAVASVWWLFALVITSSYTANLATLLATKSSTPLFTDVRELAENDLGITYGAKSGGSTFTFFNESKNDLYQSMFKKMMEQEMPGNNEAGISKVINENYAFFAESTTIEYTIERVCEVTKVGELLDSKGYGIAMKKGSQYRQALNLALLNLQEEGVLREMKNRWWNEANGGGACKESEGRENEKLSMRNFLGLFLVLAVGSALGVVVSCCDLAWAAARHPRDPSQPFLRRMWAELRFVFRFQQSVKPVRGALSPPASARASPAPSAPGSADSADSAAGSAGSAAGDAGEARDAGRLRSPSLRSASARRSSMHVASVRRARHTTAQPK